MEFDLFQVAVKVLVYNADGKLLIMKSRQGEWDLPGGRISYGENFMLALQRECQEELGIGCKILDQRPLYVWTGQNTVGAWRINVCFKAELDSMNFTESDENIEHGFFGKEEAGKLNLSPHLNGLKEVYD